MSSIIIGSNSSIASWIKLSLLDLGITPITISRNQPADYLLSDYTCFPKLKELLAFICASTCIESVYVCPGVYTDSSISGLSIKSWEYDLAINLTLPFHVYSIFAGLSMRSTHPLKIVFLGSTASVSRPINLPSYSIAKNALENLSIFINNDQPSHIRATCLRIGTSNTDFSFQPSNPSYISHPDISNCIRLIESSRIEVLPDLLSLRPIL